VLGSSSHVPFKLQGPARTRPGHPQRPHLAAVAGEVWRVAPVLGSQIRTFPSLPAEAGQDPSGANADGRRESWDCRSPTPPRSTPSSTGCLTP
jgi:hypothetical protein